MATHISDLISASTLSHGNIRCDGMTLILDVESILHERILENGRLEVHDMDQFYEVTYADSPVKSLHQ